MRPVYPKNSFLWLVVAFLLTGCQMEEDDLHTGVDPEIPNFQISNAFSPQTSNKRSTLKIGDPEIGKTFRHYTTSRIINRAVIPSECGATEFSRIQWEHFTALAADPLAMENFNFYTTLNLYAVRLGIGTDTFGEDGEFTRHVRKIEKDLERFWNMPDEIDVRGQHTTTLNDPEMLTEILWPLIADLESKDQLQPIVDEILQKNAESPLLPESPFFAADVFSSFNNMIVLGDGLIEMFSETEISEEVVWTGIFSHEWSHQIQMDYFFNWYPFGSFTSRPEETRHIELEADFFSAYYLTHKRGATYNWKKAEEFFDLFFQAGDCSFEFELHHGTPIQRMQAAKEGYLLAQAAQKKGHILTPEEVHDYFMQVALPKILPETNNL